MAQTLGEVLIKFSSNATAVISDLRKVGDASAAVGKQSTIAGEATSAAAQKSQKSISNLAGSFKDAVNKATAFSAGLKLTAAAVLGFTVKSAAEMEMLRTSFDTLTGSAEKGAEVFRALSKMGAVTPFETKDLAKATQTMMSFGISADRSLSFLRVLGDVSLGNAEKLQGLSLAFAQVQSTGRLMGQDLLQMINNGFNPLNIISQQTGKSMAELKAEMEKGGISAEMVAGAFQKATEEGGLFYKGMERGSKTFSGTMSTLRDNIGIFMRSLIGLNDEGEVVKGSFFDLLSQGARMLAGLFERLAKISPEVRQKIVSIGAAVIATTAIFLALVAAFNLIMLLLNPFMLVLAALAAIVGIVLFKTFQKLQGQVKDTAKTAADSTKVMANESKGNLGKVQKYSQETVDKLRDIAKQMDKTTQQFKEDMADIVRSHREKKDSIISDLDEEQQAFKTSTAEAETEYSDQMSKMEREHSRKTQSIQKDLDTELAKGRRGNKERVADLRDSLKDENDEYAIQTQEVTTQFDAQQAKAKATHDARVTDLQASLDLEVAFEQKHAADIAMVKDIAAKDEIDKLKIRYAEQMAQYEEDKRKAIQANNEKSASFGAANSNMMASAATAATDITNKFTEMKNNVAGLDFGAVGRDLGNKFKAAFLESLRQIAGDVWSWVKGNTFGGESQAFKDKAAAGNVAKQGRLDSFQDGFQSWLKGLAGLKGGTDYWRGGMVWTGEQGPELVNLPRGSQVIPHDESMGMAGGGSAGGPITINQNNTIIRETDMIEASRRAGFELRNAY